VTRIELKFSPAMAIAACYGVICCTTRRDKKAGPGDEFSIGGFRFRVLEVMRIPLHRAIGEFYRLEGFECPGDCAADLRECYPDLHLYESVWAHFFARLP